MLFLEQITKSYDGPIGPVPVLNGITSRFERGEATALIGESGSGKSTLMHLLAGLDRPTSGAIWFDDGTERLDIAAATEQHRARIRKTKIGLVFQQFNLIPTLNAFDNLVFQARLAGRMDKAYGLHLAEQLGLSDLLDRFPDQLSGGQQQRLAVARTFAAKPSLVLADEPTGNLDEDNSDRVIALALDLVKETNTSFIMVTHSTRLADRCHRTLSLDHGRLE